MKNSKMEKASEPITWEELHAIVRVLRKYIPVPELENLLKCLAWIVAEEKRAATLHAAKRSPAPATRARPAPPLKKTSDDDGLWDDFDNWGDNGRTSNKDR